MRKLLGFSILILLLAACGVMAARTNKSAAALSVSVIFDACYGEFDERNLNADGTLTVDIEIGAAFGELPVVTRAGFAFGGWFTEWNGAGDEITPETAAVGDTVLYAYWVLRDSFIIAFDNGGDISSVSVRNGDIVPLPAPERKGYIFSGWFTERDGAGTRVVSGDIYGMIDDLTLYAFWVKDGDGGGDKTPLRWLPWFIAGACGGVVFGGLIKGRKKVNSE